jgi:hypothetical protein
MFGGVVSISATVELWLTKEVIQGFSTDINGCQIRRSQRVLEESGW